MVSVLGMHRSGTSVLAGSLEEAGVFLGPVATSSHNNPRGNREHPDILALHEALLASSGGAWDAPPERVRWRARHRAERDRIIAFFADVPCWGFKDPRNLLVIDGWREAIPQLEFIGIVRHPLAVAFSLRERNGFSLERGLELWQLYNRRLLRLHDEKPFPIVSFDLPADLFVWSIRIALLEIGITPPPNLTFFGEGLRHHRCSLGSLPAGTMSLYVALEERSVRASC